MQLIDLYRRGRVLAKQLVGVEPVVAREVSTPLEFHGNPDAGWFILADSLSRESVVMDVGLGEDISFSLSVMARYGCPVHGFDPTPRAIDYVKRLKSQLVLHEVGLAGKAGRTAFYLPNNESHVSGSLAASDHLGRRVIEVDLVTLDDAAALIGADRIDLLKVDIEGAEYDLFDSDSFESLAPRIGMICVEFHHRWPAFGPAATRRAVARLNELGFRCAWGSPISNEEFLFVNDMSRR